MNVSIPKCCSTCINVEELLNIVMSLAITQILRNVYKFKNGKQILSWLLGLKTCSSISSNYWHAHEKLISLSIIS